MDRNKEVHFICFQSLKHEIIDINTLPDFSNTLPTFISCIARVYIDI